MDIETGKKFIISGMRIEIVSDTADKWAARNLTTGETVYFDKAVLLNAIKTGKAEQVE